MATESQSESQSEFSNENPASPSKYSLFLKDEFNRLNEKNPSFSLRSFARHIGIDQSFLSKIFKGEKKISHKTFAKIANRLEVSAEKFNQLVVEESGKLAYQSLEDNYYQLVQDWLPIAILEYAKTENFKPNIENIAGYFNQTPQSISLAIKKLAAHHFITLNEDGSWTPQIASTTPQDHTKTSAARKALQKQFLQMSLTALENLPLTERAHLGLTIALPKERFEEARDKLIDFHLEFGEYFQPCDNKQKQIDGDVYQLCLSFFPITKVSHLKDNT